MDAAISSVEKDGKVNVEDENSADNIETRRTIMSSGGYFNPCQGERQSAAVIGQCGRRDMRGEEKEQRTGNNQDRVDLGEVF